VSSKGPIIAAAAVSIIALAAAFELGVFAPGGRTTTSCPQCFQTEPILDVVMPVLGNSTSPTNPNLTVNMTAGTTRSFEVDLYPTIDVNVTMGFSSFLVSASSGGAHASAGEPSARFLPGNLTLRANGKGTTYLSLTIPGDAEPGTYSSVVSAVDDTNSSNVWGIYFQLLVSP
jgi:hypothetical protein